MARGPVTVDCFTNFQRLMWYSLSQGAVSRFYIKRDEDGQYRIKTIGFAAMFWYWFMWINTTLKVTYLVLSYHGWLGIKVHFLDQMSIWDWYLSTAHMIQEQIMWYPKYPLYENLYRQWELQEEIFTRLGMPGQIAKKITRTDKINIFYYPFVVFTGTLALGIQFFFTPKYALNTYAVVEYDTWYLQIIFCLHECFFMYHAYAYQACTMVVAESYSVSFQHLLEEMTKTLYALIEQGRMPALGQIESSEAGGDHGNNEQGKKNQDGRKEQKQQQLGVRQGQPEGFGNGGGSVRRTEIFGDLTVGMGEHERGSRGVVGPARGPVRNARQQASERDASSTSRRRVSGLRRRGGSTTQERNAAWRVPYKYLDPKATAPGTTYDILTLMHDYRRIMIAAQSHNRWIGKLMGGAQAANYAQFVSDVFMLIQLLKEDDVDYFGLSFYVMDAIFGMCMLFRMMIVLSRMYPASTDFLQALKTYATYNTPVRKFIVKTLPGFKIVAAKLTGYTMQPKSVPTAVNVLINWYIAAAMWKRPDDPTRRT